jgi:hypothetical protein
MRNHSWLILLPLVGCSLPQPRPPSAEFLVADGGSTYWVTSGAGGIHARVSPLILTRAGGRYYEVFVAETTRSYQDAIFSAEPIYRRDLVTGDTTLLWEDSKIGAWEKVYLAGNPSAQLLDPDDESDDGDVALSAMGEAEIVGVVGPYVLYSHRSTIQSAEMEQADTARGILDVGLAKSVGVASLVSDTASISGGGVRERDLTRWRHAGYDVLARFDSTRRQSEMMLRDSRRRVWKLGYVNSRVPRIFWLDEPRVDARVRPALVQAFEGALSDEGMLQLVAGPRLEKQRRVDSPAARLQ